MMLFFHLSFLESAFGKFLINVIKVSLHDARQFQMGISVTNLSNYNSEVKLIMFQVINYQSQLTRFPYISHSFKTS